MAKRTPRNLTTPEVAKRLRERVSTIKLWCKQGRFPNAIRAGTARNIDWHIPETDLEGFETRQRSRSRKQSSITRKKASNKSLQKWAGSKARKITLALVFTDIVKSTALGKKMGNEAWAEVLIKHSQKARSLLCQYDCHEIKFIGDSFMVIFRTADEALDFALEFHDDTGNEVVKIRAGIHVGPVRIIGNDIYGLMVNYTNRLVSWPEDDWVVLSNDAKKHIVEEFGTKNLPWRFNRCCSIYLKDFGKHETLWRVTRIIT